MVTKRTKMHIWVVPFAPGSEAYIWPLATWQCFYRFLPCDNDDRFVPGWMIDRVVTLKLMPFFCFVISSFFATRRRLMNLDLETIFVWRETARISLFQSRSTEAVVGKSKRFPKKKKPTRTISAMKARLIKFRYPVNFILFGWHKWLWLPNLFLGLVASANIHGGSHPTSWLGQHYSCWKLLRLAHAFAGLDWLNQLPSVATGWGLELVVANGSDRPTTTLLARGCCHRAVGIRQIWLTRPKQPPNSWNCWFQRSECLCAITNVLALAHLNKLEVAEAKSLLLQMARQPNSWDWLTWPISS